MSYYDSNFGARFQSPLLAGLLAESMNREANAVEGFKSVMSNARRGAYKPGKSLWDRLSESIDERRERRKKEKEVKEKQILIDKKEAIKERKDEGVYTGENPAYDLEAKGDYTKDFYGTEATYSPLIEYAEGDEYKDLNNNNQWDEGEPYKARDVSGWRVNPPEEFADFNEPLYLTGDPEKDKELIENIEWKKEGLLREAMGWEPENIAKRLGANKYFK